jgi:hypothetical protein
VPQAEVPSAPEARPEPSVAPGPTVLEIKPAEPGETGLRLGPRRGSTRRRGDDTLVLLPGQAVESPAPPERGATARTPERTHAPAADGAFDAEALGLPTEPAAIVRYLTHRYRGVGEKTAEALVERFGPDLFKALRDDPEAVAAAVTRKRAEQVLEAWKIDFDRRSGRRGAAGEASESRGASAERGRRGGRRRGPRGRSES